MHVRGVGPGRVLQNLLAGAKVTFLIVLIMLGFGIGDGTWGNFDSVVAGGGGSGWLLALVPVMFSYAGWNAASYVAEEIRDPGRFLPRSLALGTGAVVLLYLLLNVLYVYSMPVSQLASLQGSVMDVIAERLFGPRAGDLMGIMTAMSIAASVSAMIIAGPRVYFAMARDGLFFRKAVEIHKVYGTPHNSIIAQSAWSILLVVSGSFGQLITYTGFSVVLFSGIAGVGAVRPAAPSSGRAAAVSCLGLPGDAWAFRARQRRHRPQCGVEGTRADGRRAGHHRCWPAALLVSAAPRTSTEGATLVAPDYGACAPSGLHLLHHISNADRPRLHDLRVDPSQIQLAADRRVDELHRVEPEAGDEFMQPVCGSFVTSTMAVPIARRVPAGRFAPLRSRSTNS